MSKREFAELPPGYPGKPDVVIEDVVEAPDVPEVEVESPHWKVGDGMNNARGKPDFVIGQIAIVGKPTVSKPSIIAVKNRYDIVFFDTRGQERGRLHMTQD